MNSHIPFIPIVTGVEVTRDGANIKRQVGMRQLADERELCTCKMLATNTPMLKLV